MDTKQMLAEIKGYRGAPVRMMEVCGTHTMNIAKSGIKEILPPAITIVSGPGCPVCVTDDHYMQVVFALAMRENTIIATFGDLLKIPFDGKNLSDLRSNGCDIRLIYSPLDCITLAEKHPDKQVVFLSVGFETTTPLSALLLQKTDARNLDNLFLLVGNKVIPPTIALLLEDSELRIDALIYPGNVCVMTGERPFREITSQYHVKGAICGFSDEAIITSIHTLLFSEQLFHNCYQNAVSYDGNSVAQTISQSVFDGCDANWRGMGPIKKSGLKPKAQYAKYDAMRLVDASALPEIRTSTQCKCGEILKGKMNPTECPCFGTRCTPLSPMGPCMVSSEGSCAASYLYVKNGVFE